MFSTFEQLDNMLAEEMCTSLTALFNNMRTLKFKAQPTNAFFLLPSIKCSAAPPSDARSSENETVLSSSWKLGGAVGHLIDGSEKSACYWKAQ